jgi:hypothetical protein
MIHQQGTFHRNDTCKKETQMLAQSLPVKLVTWLGPNQSIVLVSKTMNASHAKETWNAQ